MIIDEGSSCMLPPFMLYRSLRFYQSEIRIQCRYALQALSDMQQMLARRELLQQSIPPWPPPPLPPNATWEQQQARMEESDASGEVTKKLRREQSELTAGVFRPTQEFLVAVGNVSKFFFPIGRKKNTLLGERGRILRQVYGMSDDSALSDDRNNIRELRNSIEHYDERIDEWAANETRVTAIRNLGLSAPDEGDFLNLHPHLGTISFFGQFYELPPVVTEIQALYEKSGGEAGLVLGWRHGSERVESELKGVWVDRERFDKALRFAVQGDVASKEYVGGMHLMPVHLEHYIDETTTLRGARCALGHGFVDRDGGKWCDECGTWYSHLALQYTSLRSSSRRG